MRKAPFLLFGILVLTFFALPAAANTYTFTIDDGGAIMLSQDAQQVVDQIRDVVENNVAAPWLLRIIELFGAIALGGVLVVFTKGFSEKTADLLERDIMKNFLYGIMGLLVAPILLALLALTLIGIPVTLFLLALYIILLYYAIVFAGVKIGRGLRELLFPKKTWPLFWEMVAGLTLFYVVLDWLPNFFSGPGAAFFAGLATLVRVFFLLWAAGAAIRAKRESIAKGYT
jgi:hypothetical protein